MNPNGRRCDRQPHSSTNHGHEHRRPSDGSSNLVYLYYHPQKNRNPVFRISRRSTGIFRNCADPTDCRGSDVIEFVHTAPRPSSSVRRPSQEGDHGLAQKRATGSQGAVHPGARPIDKAVREGRAK